jgi:hypothetical protein
VQLEIEEVYRGGFLDGRERMAITERNAKQFFGDERVSIRERAFTEVA